MLWSVVHVGAAWTSAMGSLPVIGFCTEYNQVLVLANPPATRKK